MATLNKVVKRQKKHKIAIPTTLTSESLAAFPTSSASALEVQEWLKTMRTSSELHSGKINFNQSKWAGAYLDSARPASMSKELCNMGFNKGRARTIVGFILGARRLRAQNGADQGAGGTGGDEVEVGVRKMDGGEKETGEMKRPSALSDVPKVA